MGEHYVFTFKSALVDMANMLMQMPFVSVGGDDGGDYEVRTPKRSAAIAVAQMLVAEDCDFEMKKSY